MHIVHSLLRSATPPYAGPLGLIEMKLFLLVTTVFFYSALMGQDDRYEKEKEVYVYQEVMPKYESGWKNFIKDLNQELDFDRNVSGSIWLYTVIDKTGEINITKIEKGISDDIDSKIVDSVLKLQGWKPGENENETISTDFPVYLRIEKGRVKR